MNDDQLESLQEDVYQYLLAAPSLALAKKILDNKGDLEGRIETELATMDDSSGKCGLAIIVLAVEVEESEQNLPGPPLMVRIDIQCIELAELNRNAGAGTLIRSSCAAVRTLAALNHVTLGACFLSPVPKNPIRPLPMRPGFVAHLVSVRTRLSGPDVVARPQGVEAAMAAGLTISTGGPPLLNEGDIAVAFPPLVPAGTYNGRTAYQGSSEAWPDANLYWTGQVWSLEQDGGSSHWRSFDDVATPDLATTWLTTGDASGTPIVTAGDAALALSCQTPDSTIRYTEDGTFPTPTSTLYAAPITGLAAGTVIRAAAYVSGQSPGDVLELTVTE